MDFVDYEEIEDDTIKDLENCLDHIKAIAQNPYNSEYFRTFIKCLEMIADK